MFIKRKCILAFMIHELRSNICIRSRHHFCQNSFLISPLPIPQSFPVYISLSFRQPLSVLFFLSTPLASVYSYHRRKFVNLKKKKKKINIGRFNCVVSTTLHPSKIPCNFAASPAISLLICNPEL